MADNEMRPTKAYQVNLVGQSYVYAVCGDQVYLYDNGTYTPVADYDYPNAITDLLNTVYGQGGEFYPMNDNDLGLMPPISEPSDSEPAEEAGGGGGDETAAEPEQEAECATEAPVPIVESYDFGNQTVVKVDTVKLSTFGNTLVEKSAALTPKIEAVGTASQSITNGWQDSSTATFTTKFGSFVEGANKLPAEILAYGNYLTNLASEYESIQEDALTALGGGN